MAEFLKKDKLVSDEVEKMAAAIVDAAYNVHKNPGPGLLEKVYEICLCHELQKKGIPYLRQVDIPIQYDNLIFDEGLRLDILGKHLGFLINFNVPLIKQGIKRFVR